MTHIRILPTSHIAKESLKAIESAIKKKPDCVAVELDVTRLAALKYGGDRSSIKEMGVGNFLIFSMMKTIQQWLGKKAGIMPGAEMLKAVELAKDNGIPVFLIDRDIRVTFQRIGNIGFKEKAKLFFLMLVGFLAPVKIDLKAVPKDDVIEEAMSFLKEKLPSFYRALVEERDTFMAHQLFHISERYENVLAVVGAGHKSGLVERLKGYGKIPKD